MSTTEKAPRNGPETITRQFAIRRYVTPFRRDGHALSRSPLDSVRSGTRRTHRGATGSRPHCFLGPISERGSSSHRKVGSSQFWAKNARRSLELLYRSSAVGGDFDTNLRATMTAVVIAWILASAVGVAVGLSLGLLPTLERIMSPFLDGGECHATSCTGTSAYRHLRDHDDGEGRSSRSRLVFFIVCSSARAGVKSVDDEWLRLSTVLNASKTQVFWHILLPVATPGIFAGLRLGLIYSLLGVVGSELISSRDGLGQLVSIYSAPVPDGSGLRDPHTSRNRRSRPQPGHELRRSATSFGGKPPARR